MQQSQAAPTILIIEDSQIGRSMLGGIFSEAGYDTVHYAKDGIEGLEQTFKLNPDLVVLDLVMPRMDGFDYLKKIRSIGGTFSNLPVIVQTALSDKAKHSQAFTAGATDLILKPVNSSELIARVSVHLDNRSLVTNLSDHAQRTQGELLQARDMQSALLPSQKAMQEIESSFEIQIASHFVPSEELSGDLWGLKQLSDHEIALYLVDFTGHGVMAALNTFRLHTLIEARLPLHNRSGEYLTELNTHLHDMLMTREFATMFYAVINTKENRMDYAAAATTNPIILQGDGKLTMLSGSGLPLSVKENVVYKTQSLPFKPGDTLITYSDALLEKQRIRDKAFDESALLHTCASLTPGDTPDLILENIIAEFSRTTGDDKIDDDLTLVILQRL